jgi:hypothetical protein
MISLGALGALAVQILPIVAHFVELSQYVNYARSAHLNSTNRCRNDGTGNITADVTTTNDSSISRY